MLEPDIDLIGTQRWYNTDGRLHRTDGPAVVFADGTEHWYHKGLRHRIDGPAVVTPYGRIVWYLEDNAYFCPEEFCEDAGIAGRRKTMFLLKYSQDFPINRSYI